jgi:hypothetical protein
MSGARPFILVKGPADLRVPPNLAEPARMGAPLDWEAECRELSVSAPGAGRQLAA